MGGCWIYSLDFLVLSDLVLMVVYLRLMVLSKEYFWVSRLEVLVFLYVYERFRNVNYYDNGCCFFLKVNVLLLVYY